MAFLKLGNISARPKGNKSAGLLAALKYIVNPKKTEGYALIGGYNLDIISMDADAAQKAYDSMMDTKDYFEKADGRQGYHYKLSFPAGDDVTPELALKITGELCQRVFPEYECCYAVHTNSNYLHSHIVFNSINMVDGYKYRYKKGDWAKYIQPVANEICKKYDLESLSLDLDEKFNMKCMNYAKWQQKNADNIKYTNAMIKADIDECISKAFSYEEFVKLMQSKGHVYDDSHKYITVLAPGRARPCRIYNLSDDKKTYTKENIIRMINGTYLSREEVRQKLSAEYDKYVLEKNRLKIYRYPPELAKAVETIGFITDKNILTHSDMDNYLAILDQMDKELNIMRKKIVNHIKKYQDSIAATGEIVLLLPAYFEYKKGDNTKKDKYERCCHLMKEHVIDKGYSLSKLYGLKVTSEQLLENINEYKKYIYVQKKICDRTQIYLDAKKR